MGRRGRRGRREPKIPKAWAELVSPKNVQSDPCETYTAELVASVRHRLYSFLEQTPAVGGGMVGTLEQQQEPLKIDDKANVGKLQSSRSIGVGIIAR